MNQLSVLPLLSFSRRVPARLWVLHIFFVPGQVSLITIAHIARASNSVKLIRVDHQLGFHPQAAQSLIHLLPALNGYVEIPFAAEKQRRRLDAIRMQKRIRNLDVGFPGLRIPWRTNLMIVLTDVLISSVERDCERSAGPTGGAFEARITRDEVIGQNSAIAPTAHSQTIGVGYALRNHMINSGQQVVDFTMTPISEDRTRVGPAAA